LKILDKLLGTQRLERVLSGVFVLALIIPAFFAAVVIGGNFGGAVAAGADEFLGKSFTLVPVGIFVGITVMLFLLLSLGALLGRGVAALVNRIVGERI
jgi:hypothetical protein